MRLRNLVFVASLMAAATPALAHHVMDGMMPMTLLQGVASGLGHPVIGLDHLAAIIAVGAVAAVAGAGVAWPLGFVVASLVGVGAHFASVDVPAVEIIVAASVIGLGAALLARAQVRPPLTVAFVLAGLVHGYAYGESIIGAEPSPLLGYLAGLLLVQAGIAMTAWAVLGRLPTLARPAGVTVAAIGVMAMGLAIAS